MNWFRRNKPDGTPAAPAGDVEVITDPLLIEAARAEVELREAARKYNRAHRKLADRLRGKSRARLGEYELRGTFKAGTVVSVPEEVRAQYSTTDEQARWEFEVKRTEEW